MKNRCGKLYRPSNGDEGRCFADSFCMNCIHGKYEHTGDVNDNPCEILSRSFLAEINDPLYPKEWVYGEDGKPTCTSFIKWDWGKDDDGNWIDPPKYPPDTDNPNQLCMPFIFEELNIKQHESNSIHSESAY